MDIAVGMRCPKDPKHPLEMVESGYDRIWTVHHGSEGVVMDDEGWDVEGGDESYKLWCRACDTHYDIDRSVDWEWRA